MTKSLLSKRQKDIISNEVENVFDNEFLDPFCDELGMLNEVDYCDQTPKYDKALAKCKGRSVEAVEFFIKRFQERSEKHIKNIQ